MKIEYLSDFDLAAASTQVVVVASAQNDNVLVADPGATQRLAIIGLKGQRTSGSSAVTSVLIKAGTTVIDYGDFSNDIPGQFFVDAASQLQIRVLAPNKALIANHNLANSITYTIRYIVIDA